MEAAGDQAPGKVPGKSTARVFETIVLPAVASCLLLMALGDRFIDDAYITFRYVNSLLEAGTWGFYPELTTNTATSPLNVMLLTALSFIVPGPENAALLLAALLLMAVFRILWRMSQSFPAPGVFALTAFVSLAASPLLLSTIGLESLLFVTLLFSSILLVFEQRWRLAGVALALLTLARPDGVLLTGLVLLFLLTGFLGVDRRVRTAGTVGGIYAATLIPWLWFSWLDLGSLVPLTFVIKKDAPWGRSDYLWGLADYFSRYPWSFTAALLVPALAIGLPLTWRTQPRQLVLLLLSFSTAHAAAYTALKVAPYHWYYVPAVAGLTLCGAAVLSSLAHRLEGGGGPLPLALPLLLQLALFAPYFLRGGALLLPPLHSNWTDAREYRRIGHWLDSHLPPGAVIGMEGEVGALAHCTRHRLSDVFSDPYLGAARVYELVKQTNVRGQIAWLNFYWLPVPPAPDIQFWLSARDPGYGIIKSWPLSSGWTSETLYLTRAEAPSPAPSAPAQPRP
ncbi:MAG: hypothetical protein IT186_13360 [Acidobacteria bacterium]|nr:hypothetical protein [Acidobacteriota bacterium]